MAAVPLIVQYGVSIWLDGLFCYPVGGHSVHYWTSLDDAGNGRGDPGIGAGWSAPRAIIDVPS